MPKEEKIIEAQLIEEKEKTDEKLEIVQAEVLSDEEIEIINELKESDFDREDSYNPLLIIDLKDDLARFQILLKIPYPNISSNKIKSRQKSNPDWYSLKTCMDILQTYGRAVRSGDDYADMFILDSNFSDLLKYNKYLPEYFLNAVKILKI